MRLVKRGHPVNSECFLLSLLMQYILVILFLFNETSTFLNVGEICDLWQLSPRNHLGLGGNKHHDGFIMKDHYLLQRFENSASRFARPYSHAFQETSIFVLVCLVRRIRA